MVLALKAKVAAGAVGGTALLSLTGLTMFMGGSGGDAAAEGCDVTASGPQVPGSSSASASRSASSSSDGAIGQPVVMDAFKGQVIHGPVGDYKGQQLVIAAHIVKVAQDMHLDSWTQTVAVMVAMGESQLVNIDYGDKAGPDSRGIYQQRDNGAWGTLADRMNPPVAAKNFLSALTKVPGYHGLSPTEAGHRAQRNADPNYYAKYWSAAGQAVALVTKDPGLLSRLPDVASGAGSTCGGGGDYLPPNGIGNQVYNLAKKKVDAHQLYVLGGGLINRPWDDSGPGGVPRPGGMEGTDCSGLTRYAYATATNGKFVMQHKASLQWDWVKAHKAQVNINDIQPGDLLFFNGSQPGHVAIAGPNGSLVEQAGPDGKPGVYIANWKTSPWHQRLFIGAGRPSKASVGGPSDTAATNTTSAGS